MKGDLNRLLLLLGLAYVREHKIGTRLAVLRINLERPQHSMFRLEQMVHVQIWLNWPSQPRYDFQKAKDH